MFKFMFCHSVDLKRELQVPAFRTIYVVFLKYVILDLHLFILYHDMKTLLQVPM